MRRIMQIPLTEAVSFEYHNTCKAMLLAVATTEATTRCGLADLSDNRIGPATAIETYRVGSKVKEVNHHGC